MLFSDYISNLSETINSLEFEQIENLMNLLFDAYINEKMVFVIGNGGSAANASHFAQDLAKGTRLSLDQEKRIRALSLTDNLSFISALGNDDGYETIFVQQLRTYANPGDLLIAISGSGNSSNIIKAVEWANENGIITIGISSFDGGKLKRINKHSVHVPLKDMCTSESIHLIIFHYIVIELSKKIKADIAKNELRLVNISSSK